MIFLWLVFLLMTIQSTYPVPFHGKKGIILGHKISKRGIEVDKAKLEVIEKLSPPVAIKGIKSFSGHVVLYKRFIKDLSKIVNSSRIY